MALEGSDPARIGTWIKDLTYAEVHAATLGAMQGAGTLAAYRAGMPSLSLGLVVAAFALLGWTKTSKTEDVPFVTSIVESVPKSLRGQIRREPHYFGGAFLVAITAAYVATAVLPT